MEACEKRRASGCSAEPDEEWLIGGVVLGGEEEIVHVGFVVIDVEVPRVPRLVVDLGN